MKISVDGGALCLSNNKRTGNLTFTENLLKALSLYDKKNSYLVYTFCQPDTNIISGLKIHFKKLLPKLGWMKWRVDIEEIVNNNDLFLALNQASPFFGTKKIISFCHGLSYYFYPNLYPKQDVIRLNNQLKEMLNRSDRIIVSSKKVQDELVSIYRLAPRCLDEGGLINTKVIILPFGVPFDMYYSKLKVKEKIFLFVANNQKIKNVDFVIDAFRKSSLNKSGYKLLLVGDWQDHKDLKNSILSLNNAPRVKLRSLYQKATALLTSSYYESFNFPVLEALSQDCPVIGLNSAIIPELKEFVNISSNNVDKFIEKMVQVTKYKSEVDFRKLKKQFSWKKYVKKLTTLYD